MKLKEVLQQISNNYPEIDFAGLSSIKTDLSCSFVIPTFNSDNVIQLVLDSINNQLLISNIKEVIVIDDGSTDATESILKEFQKNAKFKLVVLHNKKREYAAYSRNRGIKEATGDIVAFIDSDIIVPPNYLNYHLGLHQVIPNAVTVSLRSFIDKEDFVEMKNPFPVREFVNEFRVSKYINPEWCDTDEKKIYADKTVNLLDDSDGYRKLGFGQRIYWSLPDICLTCAICYRREDLILVKGAPRNFVGWGFNDVSMAAKVISLGRYVISATPAGVYHINHPPRSKEKKYQEFELNKIRYEKMLNLEQRDTFEEYIPKLD